MNKMNKMNSKQSGVGLLEILVSILVIGIGALGVASMQLTGLKFNAGSQGRTQAIFLATDMMDRMRANREIALDQDVYVIGNATGGTFVVSSAINNPPQCYEVECTPDQLAVFDQFYFLRQVEDLVPFGRAAIRHFDDADGDRIYEIQIQWRDVVAGQDREGLTVADDDINLSEFTFRSGL